MLGTMSNWPLASMLMLSRGFSMFEISNRAGRERIPDLVDSSDATKAGAMPSLLVWIHNHVERVRSGDLP